MVEKKKRLTKDERIWANQRKLRGFSDFDCYEIDSWFYRIIPEMLKEVLKNYIGHPMFIRENYYDNHIDEFNGYLKEEFLLSIHTSSDYPWYRQDKECNKEWRNILKKMISYFEKSNEEYYVNKFEEEYLKDFEKYGEKYGYFGEKIKNKKYVETDRKGNQIVCTKYEGYIIEKDPSYLAFLELQKKYRKEQDRIDKLIEKNKKIALEMFCKYLDNLGW